MASWTVRSMVSDLTILTHTLLFYDFCWRNQDTTSCQSTTSRRMWSSTMPRSPESSQCCARTSTLPIDNTGAVWKFPSNSDNDAQHDIKHYDKTDLRSSDAQHDTRHDDQPQSGSDANKGKLQFTAESNLANGLCTGASPGLMTGTSDGLCDGQKQVADDEPPIQVLLGNDYNLEHDEMEHTYEGDVFSGHLPEGKLRYLQKMYKAVPEEFYSKSKKAPVTPRNARSWMKKRRGSIFHFWEWRSGSGILSLIAHRLPLRLVPEPSRSPTHHPLDRADLHVALGPFHPHDVTRSWPWRNDLKKCRPLSTSRRRSKKEPSGRKATSLNSRGLRRFGIVYDRLQDLPGERHRTDQCRFKACDEEGNPILKPTGLGATSSSTVWLAVEDILVENMAGFKEQLVARTARHLRQYTLRVYAKPGRKMWRSSWTTATPSKTTTNVSAVQWAVRPNPTWNTASFQENVAMDNGLEVRTPDRENNLNENNDRRTMSSTASAKKPWRIQNSCRDDSPLILLSASTVGRQPFSRCASSSFCLERWTSSTFWRSGEGQGPELCPLAWRSYVLGMASKGVQGVHERPRSDGLPAALPQHLILRWLSMLLHYDFWCESMSKAGIYKLLKICVNSLWVSGMNLWTWRMTGWRPCLARILLIKHKPLHRPLLQDQPSRTRSTAMMMTRVMEDRLPSQAKNLNNFNHKNMMKRTLMALQCPAEHPGSLKPIFDFRRVFTRLPKPAGKDDVKRLILGLHERLWHAAVRAYSPSCSAVECLMLSGAWQAMLWQAAGFAGVLPPWSPSSISRCWPSRSTRQLASTRIATACQSREISRDEACAQCSPEQLNQVRRPGGTTSGVQGQKHTSSGLVEKHIDLTKLTMAKLAEAGRWGLEIEGEELASEASMAANTAHQIGGYAPSTMLFGVLPRGYLDPEQPPPGDEVSPEESACERSVRLRQIALQASQAAILESRIAKANRSRPQQLLVAEMTPGTTKVEIFRDDGGGYMDGVAQRRSWRSTSLLALPLWSSNNVHTWLDSDISDQPLRESYLQFVTEVFNTTSADVEQALRRMKLVVEQLFSLPSIHHGWNPEVWGWWEPNDQVSEASQRHGWEDAEGCKDLLELPRNQIWKRHEDHPGAQILHGHSDHLGRRPHWNSCDWTQHRLDHPHQGAFQHQHRQALPSLLVWLCADAHWGFLDPCKSLTRIPCTRSTSSHGSKTMSSAASTSGQHSDPSPEEFNKKREGPVEIVAQAPERKKAKLHLSSLWWMCQRPKKVRLQQPHEIWLADDERWMRKRSLASPTPTTPRLLLHLHCRTEAHLHIYLLTGEI